MKCIHCNEFFFLSELPDPAKPCCAECLEKTKRPTLHLLRPVSLERPDGIVEHAKQP